MALHELCMINAEIYQLMWVSISILVASHLRGQGHGWGLRTQLPWKQPLCSLYD